MPIDDAALFGTEPLDEQAFYDQSADDRYSMDKQGDQLDSNEEHRESVNRLSLASDRKLSVSGSLSRSAKLALAKEAAATEAAAALALEKEAAAAAAKSKKSKKNVDKNTEQTANNARKTAKKRTRKVVVSEKIEMSNNEMKDMLTDRSSILRRRTTERDDRAAARRAGIAEASPTGSDASGNHEEAAHMFSEPSVAGECHVTCVVRFNRYG